MEFLRCWPLCCGCIHTTSHIIGRGGSKPSGLASNWAAASAVRTPRNLPLLLTLPRGSWAAEGSRQNYPEQWLMHAGVSLDWKTLILNRLTQCSLQLESSRLWLWFSASFSLRVLWVTCTQGQWLCWWLSFINSLMNNGGFTESQGNFPKIIKSNC